MKKHTWIYISALYLFLVLMDGLLTYINTPDLSREANPLVVYFGLGWGALFLANAIGFALFVLLARLAWSYERESFEVVGGFDYYMKLFYGEGYKPAWFWYRWPKRQRPFWACAGFAVCIAEIVARAIIVAEWLTHTFDIEAVWWWRLRRAVPMHRLDVWIGILAAVILVLVWLYQGYRCCIKNSSK